MAGNADSLPTLSPKRHVDGYSAARAIEGLNANSLPTSGGGLLKDPLAKLADGAAEPGETPVPGAKDEPADFNFAYVKVQLK